MSRLGAVLRPLRGAVDVIAALPAVVEAILVLPTVSRQLDDVRADTAHLRDILVELQRVHGDTAALPAINATLVTMAASINNVERNTLAVEQLAEIALPLQGAALRIGRFTDKRSQRRLPREPEPPTERTS